MPAKPQNTIKGAVMQKKHITVTFEDGKSFSLDDTQPIFVKLKEAVRAKDGLKARKLVNAAEEVGAWSDGKLIVDKHDNVLYDGKHIHPKMHARMLKMVREKAPVGHLVKFLDNLYQNPRAESIQDLYEFMEANNLPLTEDGYFLAFKTVRNDYKDHHTGQIDNSVGQTVFIDRSKCEFNRNQTCSTGLHFCGHEYIGVMPSGKVMLVKVNPRDVTSIPTDYNNRKGRCCEYTVLSEVRYGEKLDGVFLKSTVNTRTVVDKHRPEGPVVPAFMRFTGVTEAGKTISARTLSDYVNAGGTDESLKIAKPQAAPKAEPKPKAPAKALAKKAAKKVAKKALKKKLAKKAAKKAVKKAPAKKVTPKANKPKIVTRVEPVGEVVLEVSVAGNEGDSNE
jgi:hypothetical protein